MLSKPSAADPQALTRGHWHDCNRHCVDMPREMPMKLLGSSSTAQAASTLGHTSFRLEQLMHKKSIDCVIMEVVQLCKGPAR